ncbi:MAG: multifunctional oxoglutarate decarboxylase/oxoglutarate dehydrogenase thiamine pyrophosphate-binding subunit/dihydrolipoyllysine-residue succinyltransferase subunit, partial [Microbacterium gubbeenense]
MTVARPSTPASYFHLLRRQAYSRPRHPLVVFTPKAMLRLRGATSEVADFASGSFEPVLDDERGIDRSKVTRVLLQSGKLHWDLASELDKQPDPSIALVRLEQFYPAPVEELGRILAQYPNATEFVWVQDEPENQGAWPFIQQWISGAVGQTLSVVARPAAAAPSTGSSKVHAVEQADLMKRALAH